MKQTQLEGEFGPSNKTSCNLLDGPFKGLWDFSPSIVSSPVFDHFHRKALFFYVIPPSPDTLIIQA